jgi:hypothetical protein
MHEVNLNLYLKCYIGDIRSNNFLAEATYTKENRTKMCDQVGILQTEL